VAPAKTLWSASFIAPPEAAEFLSDAFGEEALSLTIVAPPRTGKAEAEAIFDAEPDAAALRTRIAILASLQGIKAPKITVKQLPKLDWLKKVSEDFPPRAIARWVVFGAQHRDAAKRHHKIPLQIDATSAFGTGEHPTTRGCLLMLDWMLKRRSHGCAPLAQSAYQARGVVAPPIMLDMGCGSGILAMAYSKTAHGKAIGVDLDAASVEIAKSNIQANGLAGFMRVALGNGYKAPLVRQHKPYDLIMANIFAGPLCKMARDLKKHLKPGGMAILSGLLTHQANHVIAAHRMQGLRLVRHIKIGEWSILLMAP
jgi:ribosomal protein L11 methyltransferase